MVRLRRSAQFCLLVASLYAVGRASAADENAGVVLGEIPIAWSNGNIVVGSAAKGEPCNYDLDPLSRALTLHVFLEKGIVDVCTRDGRVFESRVAYSGLEDLGVEAFAKGGEATLISLDAWRMAPATIDHSRLLSERLP